MGAAGNAGFFFVVAMVVTLCQCGLACLIPQDGGGQRVVAQQRALMTKARQWQQLDAERQAREREGGAV